MTLGEKIKFERQRKKISQQQLADAAGIHQKNISKYENDTVVPSAVILKHIADTLEVSADYLLGDELLAIKDTALFQQFKQVDSLSEQDKTALVKVIDNYLLAIKTRAAYAS